MGLSSCIIIVYCRYINSSSFETLTIICCRLNVSKNFQTVRIVVLKMPKKKQRCQASSFLDQESGDSSPRLPSHAPQRSNQISPVNSRVSVGSSAVTFTSVEPRSGSASSGHSGDRLSALAEERSHSSSPGTPPLSSTVAGCAAPPDLLQIVQLSGASLQQAALDLIDAYQQDAAPAIFEVVRCAVAVSGSKFEVKLEDMERFEMAEIVEEAAAVDHLPDQCLLMGKDRTFCRSYGIISREHS